MLLTDANLTLPLYPLEPDVTGNKHFRVYNFEGTIPPHSDLLIPHRKDHYLFVFIRHATSKQWIDTTLYEIRDNTIYFAGPGNVIVKEETQELWSTGIAFTREFLSFQQNTSLMKLPVIANPKDGHELLLTDDDVRFVESQLAKINEEYSAPGEWQMAMLGAHMTVLLTYLSRLYSAQFGDAPDSADKLLLKSFLAKINESFRESQEVGDYASMLHISAGHLSEVIKLQSGRPAIKHIHERITMEARRLLFHTEHSLKDIAFDLGFSDASYFNRFFKRETGFTPAGYRVNIRKMYH